MGFNINPCPHCGHNDCYWVVASTKRVGYHYAHCFSCEEYDWIPDSQVDDLTEDNYVPKGVVHVDNVIEFDTPKISDTYVPEVYRGITSHTMEKYGVYFTKEGDDEVVHYKYPDNDGKPVVKHRKLPKDIWSTGSANKFLGHDLWTGGKKVILTEGEEDWLSVLQMNGDYPVLNFPNASPSREFWKNAEKKLAHFDEIILAADNDDAGQKLVDKVYALFPGKVYVMDMGKYKDANDFLQNDDLAGFRTAFWNAQRLKPDTILGSPGDFIKLYEETPDYQYFQTGVPELDEKILGIHKGALTVVLAPTGVGKTEFFRYLEWKCFNETDYKFAFCHREETQLRSILGLFSYWMDQNLTRKELVEDGYTHKFTEFDDFVTKDGRVFQFSIKTDQGPEDIITQVRFLASALEVDYIFIEPIQDFVSAPDTSNKESLLTDLINTLKALAPELDVGIVLIAHSNKDGEAKYAASIVQGAAFEILLERDLDAEDAIKANTTKIRVGRKNRTGGGSGPAGELFFDHTTFTMRPELT